MRAILVVDDPSSWHADAEADPFPHADVVSATEYLTRTGLHETRRARVFNLCRDYGYQTTGYYVSLLAEARGHRPLPSVVTLEDLRPGGARLEVVSEELRSLVDKLLAPIASSPFTLSVYFGRNLAKRYDRLAQALFESFPTPLLRCRFARTTDAEGRPRWRLASVRAIPLGDVPKSHRPFLLERARRFFDRPRLGGRRVARADIAVLVDPEEREPPSNPKALERFASAARKRNVRVETITSRDYARLPQYDALFIRSTTAVNHFTYRFARRAESEGMVVIDDPTSIVRCTNKVYQAELFQRRGVPCPATQVVHAENLHLVGERLGFPLVLKQPDGAFSMGVVRVEDAEQLEREGRRLLAASELVVGQAFLRSEFDWRVGTLGGRPLWVCRYHFPRGHWQIQENREGKKARHGRHETLAVEAAPRLVIKTALEAARHFGDGLYGVDLKEVDGRAFVIEVNDNPNLDASVEDTVGKESIYRAIVDHFVERIETRGRSPREEPAR